MTSRLFCTKGEAPVGQIPEFSTVALRHGVEIAPIGYFPGGSRGIVVFTHDGGVAYEVEFAKPVCAVLTLNSDDIEPVLESNGEHDSEPAGGLSSGSP